MNLQLPLLPAIVLCGLALLGLPRAAHAQQAPGAANKVLDFCHMPVQDPAEGYVKRRLVMFDVAGRDVSEAPEPELDEEGKVVRTRRVYREAHVHDHVRTVLLGGLPLLRFHNVVSSAESPDALRGQARISDAQMIQAAGADSFAAYSLACADVVVMPRVVGRKAAWRKVDREITTGSGKKKKTKKYKAWDSSPRFEVAVDLYERAESGDWELRETADAKNGGLADFTMGLAAMARQGNPESELTAASARPDPECRVPGVSELTHVFDAFESCSDAQARAFAALQASVSGEVEVELEAEADGQLDVDTAEAEADGQLDVETAEDVAARARSAAKAVQHMKRNGTPDIGSLATLADAAGLADTPFGEAAQSAAQAVEICRSAVEAVTESAKTLRNLAQAPSVDAIAGLAGCAGITMNVDLGASFAPGSAERGHDTCGEGMDAVGRGNAGLRDSAICASRVAADLMREQLRKDLRAVWAFQEEILRGDQGREGVRVGKAEGVRRGDWFVTVRENGREGSRFARVDEVGPGGPDGQRTPSTLSWKSRSAGVGTEVKEHPQIGVVLGVLPVASYILDSGDLDVSLAYGGGIVGGYDATRFVPFADEVWSRVYVYYQTGGKGDTMLTISLAPQATYYVGGRFALFVGVAADFVFVMLDEDELESRLGITADDSAAGFGITASASFGFEVALRPDWNLRAYGSYRQGFKDIDLEVDDTKVASAGTLSAITGSLSLGYTF